MAADPSSGSITQLFVLVREGDEAAAARLWERFVPRLLGLARRTLAQHPRLNGFADDVVQSVFASFFCQAQAGEFVFDHRQDVWNLLGVMTVRKARQAIRWETADKRDGGRIVRQVDPSASNSPAELVDPSQLGPDFDLYAEELLSGLPEELRTVAVLRFMGHTNAEIAQHLDWTVRKVERKLHLIRLTWQKDYSEK